MDPHSILKLIEEGEHGRHKLLSHFLQPFLHAWSQSGNNKQKQRMGLKVALDFVAQI